MAGVTRAHHGHVKSVHVFVVADSDGNQVCKVGGHDNTLLGRPTHFKEHVDVLMFGHLLFEMAAGYELTTALPTTNDYSEVQCSEALEVIIRAR